MASRKHENTAARRAALQVLYSGEMTDSSSAEIINQGLCCSEGEPLSDYAVRLVQGVGERAQQIDERLATLSENWSLLRMPIVDRCILRLAAFEMLFVDEVPISVTVNEAVELAKAFGGEDESPRFVNGVLGRMARQIEGTSPAEEPAEAAAVGDTIGAAATGESAEAAAVAPALVEPAFAVQDGQEAEAPLSFLEGEEE